jgi:hypothetical protein
MLNLFQHLTKSWTYETLKRVQGDRLGLFCETIKIRQAIHHCEGEKKIKYQSTGD